MKKDLKLFRHLRNLLWLLLFFLFALPTMVAAAGNPSLDLTVKAKKVSIGKQFTVEIQAKSAPAIYGVQVGLAYDPAMVEVVDMDPNTEGIQFQAGTFIDPAQSYSLMNQVDPQKGTIDYALTLLNPAPEVKGNGQIALITFKAKTAGKATITLSTGMFGTRTGETISPKLVSAQIEITSQSTKPNVTPANIPVTGSNLLLVGAGFVGLAGISLGGILLWRKRRPLHRS
jgi:trimeric autotransporter adhesin